jgi:hypothetical protein
MSNGDNIREDRRRLIELQHVSDLAEYNVNVQWSLESFKAGNLAGREALKAITFIN